MIVLVTISGSYGGFILAYIVNWIDTTEKFYHVMAGTGTFILSIAGIYTAFVGLKQFQLNRSKAEREIQEIRQASEASIINAHHNDDRRKLRFELANRAIDLAHQAQADLQSIRNPTSYGGEYDVLKEQLGEAKYEEIRGTFKINGVITLMRFAERAQSYADISAIKPKFRLLFRNDQPFENILAEWRKVHAAAEVIRLGATEQTYNKQIWDHGSEDEISLSIGNSVKKIEELCLPILTGEFENFHDAVLNPNP